MTAAEQHYLNPTTFDEGDARTADLWYLDPVVLTHLRTSLNALDAGERGRASVRLHYAVETAVLRYGPWHTYTDALRSFRRIVDVRPSGPRERDLSVAEALVICLATLTEEAAADARMLG